MRASAVYLWLSQYRWFARATAACRLGYFTLRKAEHSISEGLRAERLQSSAFRELVRLAVPSLALSASFVAAIAWLEWRLHEIGLTTAPDATGGTYTDIMLGLAGMGGVFIGLYYAAISAVATQAYSDVPGKIRYLLAADLASRTYMRLLTFVTCFALLHLALQFTIHHRSGIAVTVALILAALSVVIFVLLGNRAFHLLEPTALTQELIRNLDHWVERAARNRLRSSEPAFQQHARTQAASAIATLEAIAERSMATLASRASTIPTLFNQLLGAQLRYLAKKPTIPIDSRWYPQVNVQRRWFTTSDTVTSIAAQTGTGLQPDSRPDRFWVETSIDVVLEQLLNSLTDPNNIRELSSCLATLADALQRRARAGDTAGCVSFWTKLSGTIASSVVSRTASYPDKLLPLSIADALGSIPVSIALGLREYTERFSVANLQRDVDSLSRLGRTRFPFEHYPFHFVERIDWIIERVEYERRAEGRPISPTWYHWELLRQVEVLHLDKSITAIIATVPSHYEVVGTVLQNPKEPHLEAAFLERRMEYFSKARMCVDRVADRFATLTTERRVDGLLWATIERENLEKRLDEHEGNLVDRMALLSVSLFDAPESEGIPDYEGRFLAEVSDATFEAASDANSERFNRLFPALALGTVKLSEQLRSRIPPGSTTALDPHLLGSVAATAQFLDIAGYVCVFSALHGKPELWIRARETLDIFFKVDAKRSGEYLVNVLTLSEYGRLGIPHMSTFRHWRRELLTQRLGPFMDESRGGLRHDVRINHPSIIVRLMADSMGLGPEGLDLFALMYIHKELGVPIKELGYRVESMARELARDSESTENGD